jgi:hypothetical protein
VNWVIEQRRRGTWVVLKRYPDQAAAKLELRRLTPSKAAIGELRVREKPIDESAVA